MYGVNYILAYNLKDNNLATLGKKLTEAFGTYFDTPDINDDENGFCAEYHLDKGLFILMVIKRLTNSPEDKSVLAHECFHATEATLKSRGIKYCKETTEVWAYNIEMLVRIFSEDLGKKCTINKREIRRIIKLHKAKNV